MLGTKENSFSLIQWHIWRQNASSFPFWWPDLTFLLLSIFFSASKAFVVYGSRRKILLNLKEDKPDIMILLMRYIEELSTSMGWRLVFWLRFFYRSCFIFYRFGLKKLRLKLLFCIILMKLNIWVFKVMIGKLWKIVTGCKAYISTVFLCNN